MKTNENCVTVIDQEIDEFVKKLADIHNQIREMDNFLLRDKSLPNSVHRGLVMIMNDVDDFVHVLKYARQNALKLGDSVYDVRQIQSITLLDGTVVKDWENNNEVY